MKKVNQKIYKTIEFKSNAQMLAFVLGGFILLLVGYIVALTNIYHAIFVLFVIIHCLLFLGFALWYAFQLISLASKSTKFLFFESADFSIVPNSMSFRGGFFAIKVVVDGKTFTTGQVVNANDLARATELNKIEIGVKEEDDEVEVIVVKPI